MAAPPGLASRTLGRLRHARRGEDVQIAAGDRGRDTVSTSVVALVSRRAATSVDAVLQVSVVVGVPAAGADVVGAPPAGAKGSRPAGADDRPDAGPRAGVAIDVHLTASLGPPLAQMAARVRAAILADVGALVGVHVTRVDVTVDDVV